MEPRQEDKKKVEAVLFTTGRFMTLEEVSQGAGIGSSGYVKELLDELKKEYETKDTAITLQILEDKFKLNIKKEYGYIANKLVATTEMDNSTTKTLAVIGYKDPALQSDIIKIRGNKAYDHIHILKEQGLILTEKHGRTNLIKLTPKFYEYFDTAAKEVKEKFDAIVEQQKQEIANQTIPSQPLNNEVKAENIEGTKDESN